ncbi:hypothetical protein MLD38_005595 [Melastoma candidum]|uniref:Uncharacterized protein n=1 Tax=Melastoma candidum TaxID=119954 RepID=A0ACB9RJJ7_9MYRT|nr:hypothetical protein MLD38_005595 [Melastoma candidum]
MDTKCPNHKRLPAFVLVLKSVADTFPLTMEKFPSLLFVLVVSSVCRHASALIDGLLPNGNFENGPKPWELKGTVVTNPKAIPSWEISGYVEYIKYGQKQGDMLLVVPEGDYAVRLGNEALIKQKVSLVKDAFYSITFSAARTCTQDGKVNVSVSPNKEDGDWGIFPIQTLYSSNGWDSYSWAFKADAPEVEISIHNPGVSEDRACGPLIDSVALKGLSQPRRTGGNLVKNGDFEEGPYIFPNTSWGVLVPPQIEDDHSPLPGWAIKSLKAVKYIDSDHFSVPSGRRAVELVAGRESVILQPLITIPGRHYLLTFLVGDAKNSCEGSMAVEAYVGKESVTVPFTSKGKGDNVRGRLEFTASLARTQVSFRSSYYSMTTDNTGSLCGPVIDDVVVLGVRKMR